MEPATNIRLLRSFLQTEIHERMKRIFTFFIFQARVDWKIIRVVSEVVDEKLPYDKLPELRARMAEVRLDCFAFAN